jgi:hypothetical protein
MNPVIKQLAEEAGFCFWSDEEWKPKDAVIDWSAEYDDEFQKYTELLIKECVNVIYDNVEVALDATGNVVFEHELLKKHFGIE